MKNRMHMFSARETDIYKKNLWVDDWRGLLYARKQTFSSSEREQISLQLLCIFTDLLGIPDTNFSGRSTLMALRALRALAFKPTFNSFILRTLRRKQDFPITTRSGKFSVDASKRAVKLLEDLKKK